MEETLQLALSRLGVMLSWTGREPQVLSQVSSVCERNLLLPHVFYPFARKDTKSVSKQWYKGVRDLVRRTESQKIQNYGKEYKRPEGICKYYY